MAAVPELESLLLPGRTLRAERGAILSALAGGDTGAPYDRRATVYDRLVGNTAYNRLAWGASPEQYTRFAAEAVEAAEVVDGRGASGEVGASGEAGAVGAVNKGCSVNADSASPGPLLDVGCGSATFTASAYANAVRPLVLMDRSLDMLTRADARLPGGRATLVQADLMDSPFRAHGFAVVACFGVLHVLDDPWAALRALRTQLAPGGRLFVSMLVADRRFGRWYLTALHRAGEVGPPRRSDELTDQARAAFGDSCAVERTGSMAWLRATAS